MLFTAVCYIRVLQVDGLARQASAKAREYPPASADVACFLPTSLRGARSQLSDF